MTITNKASSIILKFTLMLYSIGVFAQPSLLNKFPEEFRSESVYQLNNDTIKREIASFISLTKLDSVKNSIEQIPVKEIPLKKCTENLAYFEVKSIWSTQLIVSIELSSFDTTRNKLSFDSTQNSYLINNLTFLGTKGAIPKRQIAKITSSHGPHYHAKIPDSAYRGIYEPTLCTTSLEHGIKEDATCKLYVSFDGSRRYLYVICGSGKDKYEVVWIINRTRYFGRVINKID
jgi:hypothetical protein